MSCYVIGIRNSLGYRTFRRCHLAINFCRFALPAIDCYTSRLCTTENFGSRIRNRRFNGTFKMRSRNQFRISYKSVRRSDVQAAQTFGGIAAHFQLDFYSRDEPSGGNHIAGINFAVNLYRTDINIIAGVILCSNADGLVAAMNHGLFYRRR